MELAGIEADSGEAPWSQQLDEGLLATSDLVAAGDSIFLGTATWVSSLDPTDGAVRCTAQVHRPPCWSPVTTAGTVAIVDDTSTISGLDPATGARTWTIQLDRPVSAQPTIAGDGLLVPTGDRLIEVDLNDGDVRWQTDAPHRIDAPPTVVDGTLVILSATGQRSALR